MSFATKQKTALKGGLSSDIVNRDAPLTQWERMHSRFASTFNTFCRLSLRLANAFAPTGIGMYPAHAALSYTALRR